MVFVAALAVSATAQTYSFNPVLETNPSQKNPLFQVTSGARGAAAGLRITVCAPDTYAGATPFDYSAPTVRAFIDVVDAQGNVVNDLVVDQSIEVAVDLGESGSENGRR